MKKVKIRVASIDDARSIATIHVKTWKHTYKSLISDDYLNSLSIEKREKNWRDALSNLETRSQTFVSEVDGQVVGFCCVGPCRDADMDQDTGELWSIYVDPSSMGQGAGTFLQEKAFNYLQKAGYKTATLWVLDTNMSARKWYELKGWKVEGKRKMEKIGGQKIREIRYIKKL